MERKVILAAALAVILLGGCLEQAGTGQTPTPTTSPAKTPAPTPAKTPKPTIKPSPATSPTTMPTATPTPTPTPTITPTTTPTPTPTPTPTATPSLGQDTYQTGSIITGLSGAGEYSGQALSVKVREIWSATEVQLTLFDESGGEISTVTLGAGDWLDQAFMDSSSNAALANNLQVTKINFNQATGYATVVIKEF